MTKQEQSEYISALQKECKVYYDKTLTLKDELREAEHEIRRLNVELSLARLKYAQLKERYVKRADDETGRTTDTDSTI